MTSPSCTMYSFPSSRTCPASLAPGALPSTKWREGLAEPYISMIILFKINALGSVGHTEFAHIHSEGGDKTVSS